MGNWLVRVTRRCLVDDLGFSHDDAGLPLDVLADRNGVVRAFRDKRSQNPEGQETVSELQTSKVVFTIHAGEDRGATWFQRPILDDGGNVVVPGIVWLLAARLHRSGQPGDAYPYIRRLDAAGALLPTRDDVRDALAEPAADLAASLRDQVPDLIRAARAAPGQILETVVAERVPIRIVYQGAAPGVLTVAVSQRVLPSNVPLPPRWQIRIAAAFFPETRPEDISWEYQLAGSPLRPDEVAFCDLVDG
jgi:hypothetical protein